jgi:diguanylate cyclase (GGDEF)-like protein
MLEEPNQFQLEQQNLRWFIRFQWVAVAVTLTAGLLVHRIRPAALAPYLGLVALVAGYSLAATAVSRLESAPYKELPAAPKWLITLLTSLNTAALLAAIQLTGGAQSPLLVAFPIVIPLFGIFLSRRLALLHAALSMLLLAALLGAQTAAWMAAGAARQALDPATTVRLLIYLASLLLPGVLVASYLRARLRAVRQVEIGITRQAETTREMLAALKAAPNERSQALAVLVHLEKLAPFERAVFVRLDGLNTRPLAGLADGKPLAALPATLEYSQATTLGELGDDPSPRPLGKAESLKTWQALGLPDCRGSLCLPLVNEGKVSDLALLGGRSAGVFDPATMRAVQPLVEQAALALHSARLAETMRQLVTVDSLTNLYNARQLSYDLERMLLDRRQRTHFSVLVCQPDHLPHEGSPDCPLHDSLVRELSNVIAAQVRAGASAYRTGAQEFTILLPQTAWPRAVQIAERLRKTVEGHDFSASAAGQPTQRLTLSIGLATYPEDASEPGSLLHGAATALVEALKSRNTVRTLNPGLHHNPAFSQARYNRFN